MSDSFDIENLFTGIDTAQADPSKGTPGFFDLFGPSEGDPFGGPGGAEGQETFAKIEAILEDPKPIFTQNYYQSILTGEGEIANRVHQLLGTFLKATDPQDRSVHRGRLVPAVWELMKTVAGKAGGNLPLPKKYFLRYALLLPTTIGPEHRKLISQIPEKNTTGQPIFYQDEWLKEVSFGRVSVSATDETKAANQSQAERQNAQLDKARGRYEAQCSLINGLVLEMKTQEGTLMDAARRITYHDNYPGFDNYIQAYTEPQKMSFSEVNSILRQLSNTNRKLAQAYSEFETIQDQIRALENESGEAESAPQVDTKAAEEEMGTLRQMAKLAVGRQGNHFNLLFKQYWPGAIRDTGTREQVLNGIADCEYLDPGIFQRTFKGQTTRIVPNIILLPCYGDLGVCWEPFERRNRATSRGRLAIPMYPKELRTAILAALGDLRWQVAKEKAQHYWMEEGLTGWYWQAFTEKKLKGDVKDQFIQDYILWISKESEGTQKLDRDVRDIFWRYMPFPQEVKDNLKNRGFVYAELAKKDLNRSMSDGY